MPVERLASSMQTSSPEGALMPTSSRSFASYPLVVGLVACLAACGPSADDELVSPGPAVDMAFDDEDAHADDGLDPSFDDGLGAVLDMDEGVATPEEGDAGGDAATVAAGSATCDSDAKTGDYCGGDKVSGGDKNTLYRCNGPGRATVLRRCSAGCSVNTGTDDTCKVPVPAGPASCPHVSAVLRFGLHPLASDRLRCVGVTAARITQTIGGAQASAGTHLQDGVASGHPYSAATDLSVRGLTDAQVRVLVARLDAMGFAAFFRNPGRDGWPASEARHVHVVFAGARMKASLRAQIADFLAGKNGLASHTAYTFYMPPPDVKAAN
jgi:hypothetical protein